MRSADTNNSKALCHGMINTSSLLTVGAFRLCFYHEENSEARDADFHNVLCDVVHQYMFDKRLNHSCSVINTDFEQFKQPVTVELMPGLQSLHLTVSSSSLWDVFRV